MPNELEGRPAPVSAVSEAPAPEAAVAGWWVFRGDNTPPSASVPLPEPPPWRGAAPQESPFLPEFTWRREEIDAVNTALLLRRPLLVTGPPGCGKSTLGRIVARDMGWPEPFRWPINSKSILQDGLYHYDAVARLQAANLRSLRPHRRFGKQAEVDEVREVAAYLRLGPLGSALALSTRLAPRAVIIDEFDKCDLDLPDDLLDVLEEGAFEIPELVRIADRPGGDRVWVATRDPECRVEVLKGVIRRQDFPFVVIACNQDRELTPAFRRRIIPLHLDELREPDEEKKRSQREKRLRAIVHAHMKNRAVDPTLLDDLVTNFLALLGERRLATDQLLNASFMAADADGASKEHILQVVREIVFHELERS